MRILFVSRHRGWFGGVEQNVADSARALGARGHQCFLAYGNAARDPEDYDASFEGTFSCRDLDPTGKATLQGLVESLDVDVVYLHSVPASVVHGYGRRTVRMIHDHDLCCPRRHKYFAWNGKVCDKAAGWRCWLDGAFVARDRTSALGFRFESIGKKIAAMRESFALDALLVGSAAMLQELVTNGCPRERVHVVPPAVALTTPREAPPLELARNVLYVGQLVKGKGVDLLLRALAQLTTPFQARIVGDGNARRELEALASSLSLNDRIRFEGWIPHEQLSDVYRWARVVAVPSRWPEPFGMVGLEAMGHGRPVVAFDSGGIRDWLAHEVTGLLVPTLDTKHFASALERALNDDKFAISAGDNGFSRANGPLSFERLIDRLEEKLLKRLPCVSQ